MTRSLQAISLIPLVFLASCGKEIQGPPAVEVRTVEVRVPVPTPCLTAEQMNALIAREPARVSAQLTGDAVHDLDVVSASAIRLRAYTGELRAALRACTG